MILCRYWQKILKIKWHPNAMLEFPTQASISAHSLRNCLFVELQAWKGSEQQCI